MVGGRKRGFKDHFFSSLLKLESADWEAILLIMCVSKIKKALC